MTTIHWLIFIVAFVAVNGFIDTPIKRTETFNTIFGDEKLEGEIFENVDSFSNINLFNDESNPYRLPDTTKPIEYTIVWTIDIERLTYEGTVDINIVATREGVSEIILHSAHHDILEVNLLSPSNAWVPSTYALLPEYHFLRIRPSTDMEYNATTDAVYRLSIRFGAEMRDDMYGIYKSWFRSYPTDNVSWMASTQFQATAGRYAFPCYDEPKFKANFDITVRRPTGYRSWSCTRLNNTIPAGTGWEDDIFMTTPKMSTYLLAIIVANYDSQYVNNANGQLLYEVIARPGAVQQNQTNYAFDVGQELLAAMDAHTGIEYYSMDPGLKMTQAAIPDFGAGAMENWGLLTYREAYLLYDENESSDFYKQVIAYILSHEIAHMWFGNFVTNDWWDVLWLNEGFARYYEYFLTHWVEECMGFETRFIIEQVHTALLTDSSNNPHPLTNPGVGSPASVSAMFSTISYNKGGVIIRQTEHLLGFEVHRMGLNNYLTRKAFDTVLPVDLFTDLETVGYSQNALQQYGPGFDFQEYYRSWTEQPGHPVLNVLVDHSTGRMTITQRRFNINTGYGTNEMNYVVPITFATASDPDFLNTKPSHILRETVTVIDRGTVGDEWVIFNKQQTGFYRVNYDDYTWDLITLALKGDQRNLIHEYNRAQIVNDVFQFARAGLMTYTKAFSILSFLENETSYAPWVAAMTGFNWIRNRLQGTTQLAEVESMMVNWATTVMNELGYIEPANEDFMRSYLRFQLAPFMCNMQVEACRTTALSLFRGLVDSGIEVTPNSRTWVYCNGLRQGSETDFTFMWTRFLNHNVYTEKILLLQTLGCTPHVNSLTIFMNAIVQENYIIRPQDYTSAWNTAVTGNEANTLIALNYVQNNLQSVINAFGNAATPLSYISARFRNENDINMFQTWAQQNQATLGDSYNAVYNGAEAARESIRWAAAVQSDINEYLTTGGYNISTTTSTTAAPVVVTTVATPELVRPEDPPLTDSASSKFLSMTLIAVVVVSFVAK